MTQIEMTVTSKRRSVSAEDIEAIITASIAVSTVVESQAKICPNVTWHASPETAT